MLHWTGHSGCVILAPHLVGMRKTDLGLPHFDQATERQRRDGMCWQDENELYNAGRAFKMACRDRHGVVVTIIADNYYGYCKKEVKSQISYAANLYRPVRGGARRRRRGVSSLTCWARISCAERPQSIKKVAFEDAMRLLDGRVERRPEGYAVDRNFPEIFYVPENADFNVREGWVRWPHEGCRRRNHPASRAHLRAAFRLQGPAGEAVGRHGVAAGRLGGARDALP